MANVDLKTNFKNGDKLYDYELNNNFKAIQAALGAMNKIVWQNDDNASLVMFAGTTEQITNRELIEGQLLYNTQTGETYIDAMVDTELKRVSTGGGTSIQIGGIEPTNPATKLWVEEDTLDTLGTEIVNEYSESTNLGYSADYVNKNIVSSGSNANGNWIKYSDGTMICYGSINIVANESRSAGGLSYYSGATTITLPQTFIDTNYKSQSTVEMANMNYFAQSYIDTVSTSQIIISFVSTGQNETRNIHYIAIGRWKA